MNPILFVFAFLLYYLGIWVSVTTTYQLSKKYKDWRGFPAFVLYALCWLSWITYLDILYVRALVYVLDNMLPLFAHVEGFCFAVADDPRFLVRAAAKYTKTEKINVIDLFVDIARKIIKI